MQHKCDHVKKCGTENYVYGKPKKNVFDVSRHILGNVYVLFSA